MKEETNKKSTEIVIEEKNKDEVKKSTPKKGKKKTTKSIEYLSLKGIRNTDKQQKLIENKISEVKAYLKKLNSQLEKLLEDNREKRIEEIKRTFTKEELQDILKTME